MHKIVIKIEWSITGKCQTSPVWKSVVNHVSMTFSSPHRQQCVILNYIQICNTEKLMTKGLELLLDAQKVLLG